MTSTLRSLLLGCLLLSSLAPSALAGDTLPASPRADILRFRQVDRGLYRGGQPDAQGFEQLKQLGIRTIVNLRNDDEERRVVEALGMRYVALPVTLRPFGFGEGFSRQLIQRFFEVVDDAESGPVFVHCRHGRDRTGTMVALYRILRQGWTPEAAYDEARAIGMKWWHFRVRSLLENVGTPPGAR